MKTQMSDNKYPTDGTGVLFTNRKKNDREPDYKGYYFHHETNDKIFISAWEKTSQFGEILFSLKHDTFAQKRHDNPQPQQQPQNEKPTFERKEERFDKSGNVELVDNIDPDDIPF
jgi:hypothetical protein